MGRGSTKASDFREKASDFREEELKGEVERIFQHQKAILFEDSAHQNLIDIPSEFVRCVF